jgi:hypothetical protein
MIIQTTGSICGSALKEDQKEIFATLSKDSSRLLEKVETEKLDKNKQTESFDELFIKYNKNSSMKNPEKWPNDKALNLKRKAKDNADKFTDLNSQRKKNYSHHDYDSKKSKTSEYDKRSHASEKHIYNGNKKNYHQDREHDRDSGREHNRDRHRHHENVRDRNHSRESGRGRESDRDRHPYRERSSEKNSLSDRSSSHNKHYHNRNFRPFCQIILTSRD